MYTGRRQVETYRDGAGPFKRCGSPLTREGPVKWRFAATCNLLGLSVRSVVVIIIIVVVVVVVVSKSRGVSNQNA